jgi:hypothetical protein
MFFAFGYPKHLMPYLGIIMIGTRVSKLHCPDILNFLHRGFLQCKVPTTLSQDGKVDASEPGPGEEQG